MSIFLRLLTLISIFACSNMRLKVASTYESEGKKGNVTFEKSYNTGAFPWICGFTAIFWGGGCWAYLAMPMVPQEQLAINDTKMQLTQSLQTKDIVLISPVVTRESWDFQETQFIYEPIPESVPESAPSQN